MKDLNKYEYLTSKEIIEMCKERKLSYPEEILMEKFYKKAGEFATVHEISKYFKVAKSTVYKFVEERRLVSVKIGDKLLILSETLVNLLSSNEEAEE